VAARRTPTGDRDSFGATALAESQQSTLFLLLLAITMGASAGSPTDEWRSLSNYSRPSQHGIHAVQVMKLGDVLTFPFHTH
jgi:hypothetical protein